MSAFESAWALLKTDMRLPNPIRKRPSWTDPHANLAVYGSRIPNFRAFEQGENPIIPPDEFNMDSFMESVRHELERRRGERVFAPVMNYDVGDFGDNMKDGIIDESFSLRCPEDVARPFKAERDLGAEALLFELERASMINALNDAGIFDEKSLADITDIAFQYMDSGIAPYSREGKRMDNDKGEYMIRRPMDDGI